MQILNLVFHYTMINVTYSISAGKKVYTNPLYLDNFFKNYAGNFNKLYMLFKGRFCLT